MTFKIIAGAAFAALLFEGQALAESCVIQVTGPEEQWKFLHVYDVATDSIVLRQAMKSGDSKTVTVSGDKVRIDWKYPGYEKYRTGTVMPCKGGNIVRT